MNRIVNHILSVSVGSGEIKEDSDKGCKGFMASYFVVYKLRGIESDWVS